jgi:hypothetical protein
MSRKKTENSNNGAQIDLRTAVVEARVSVLDLAVLMRFYEDEQAKSFVPKPRTKSELLSRALTDFANILLENKIVETAPDSIEAAHAYLCTRIGSTNRSGYNTRTLQKAIFAERGISTIGVTKSAVKHNEDKDALVQEIQESIMRFYANAEPGGVELAEGQESYQEQQLSQQIEDAKQRAQEAGIVSSISATQISGDASVAELLRQQEENDRVEAERMRQFNLGLSKPLADNESV